MSVHPILLSALLADVVRHGPDRAAKDNNLGVGVLLADLPTDVSLPGQTTKLGLMRPPSGVTQAGLTLDMVCWPLRRKSLPLGKTALDMGRDTGNELVIPHAGMSKKHARFVLDGDAVTVLDLGSSNGTFVGQATVASAHPHPLKDRDVVRVGDMAFTFLSAPALLTILAG